MSPLNKKSHDFKMGYLYRKLENAIAKEYNFFYFIKELNDTLVDDDMEIDLDELKSLLELYCDNVVKQGEMLVVGGGRIGTVYLNDEGWKVYMVHHVEEK